MSEEEVERQAILEALWSWSARNIDEDHIDWSRWETPKLRRILAALESEDD